MNRLCRFLVCIFFFGFSLYSYVDKQNELTRMKMSLPEIVKEIKSIQEDNTRLKYEINQFESPEHLIQLTKDGRFSHLRYPFISEVVTLPEPIALQVPAVVEEISSSKPKVSIALGAKQ